MPKRLLCYLSSDFTDGDVHALRLLATEISMARSWRRTAPQFVDEVDASSCTRPEDEPVRTVGAMLLVSSPGESPETTVEEPAALLEALARFSKARHVDFEVQLENLYVGEVRDGEMDHLLREGLLDTW